MIADLSEKCRERFRDVAMLGIYKFLKAGASVRWSYHRLLVIGALISAMFATHSPAHAQSPRRVALVVGIDAYQHIAPLKKAVGDGRAIAAALTTDLRFDAVITAENPTRRQLNAKLGEFEAAIRPGDLAMFFFSGHGVALGGENILLPADLPKPGAGQDEVVRDEGFSVDNIVRRIQRKGARVTLMVIDACRDNPFEQSGIKNIGTSRGLARPDTPQGVFMLFAAGVGQTARDRLSDADPVPTSVFTRHLLPALTTPGLTLVQIAKRVQQEVDATARTVAHAQQPAYYDQIVGDVVMREGATPTSAALALEQISRPIPTPVVQAPSRPALTLRMLRSVEAHAAQTNQMDVSADGTLAATAGKNDEVRLWNPQTLQPIGAPLKGHTYSVYAVAISGDGRLIASGSGDNSIRIWSRDGKLLRTLTGHTDTVTSLQFYGVSNDSLLVSTGHDQTVRLWDQKLGRESRRAMNGHVGWGTVAAVSGRMQQGERAGPPISAGRDGTIRVWSRADGSSSLLLGHEYIVWSLDVSPSGELVSAGADKTIRRWSVITREQRGPSLLFHTDEVWTARYSRDGSKILSGGADGLLVLWDAAKGERITSIIAHPNGVSGAHELPDGTIITSGCDASTPATGCTRSTLKLWSLAP